MKTTIFLFLSFLLVTNAFGQNRSKFHHKIKKADIDDGYLILVYKNGNGSTQSISLCSKYLKGIITLDKGVPVIDFWSISDDKYSIMPECISNNTELGRFEIDLTARKKVGDPTKFIVVPFRAWTWGVGTTPFRYRPKSETSFSTISASLGVSVEIPRKLTTSFRDKLTTKSYFTI